MMVVIAVMKARDRNELFGELGPMPAGKPKIEMYEELAAK